MKPILLTMQAFGPYAKTETIDFGQLENRTMFVISGKTGAGKTTIFDGIAFAIYGKTSGEERTGTDLRSQFANEDLLTEVTLKFSLRNHIYKIIRSPQQGKKKARGDGYTTINSKAELYRLVEGHEKLIASNVREVDEKIKELMQLDFHQFKQILMIPQGEFRKLLTSDSKDKEQILQRLFHTEIYKNFQEKLKEESSLLRKQVGQSRQDRLKWIGSIEPGENELLKELLLADPVHEDKIISVAMNEVATQKLKMKELTDVLNSGKEKRDRLIQEIERAAYLEQAFVQLKELKEYLKQLTEHQSQIEDKKNFLERAKLAEKLWPLKMDLAERETQLKEREQQIERIKTALYAAKADLEKGVSELQKLENQKDDMEINRQTLRELQLLEKKLVERSDIERSLNTVKNEGIRERKLLEQLEGEKNLIKQKLVVIDQETAQLHESKDQLFKEKELLHTNRFLLNALDRGLKLQKQIQQFLERLDLLKVQQLEKEHLVKKINDKKQKVNEELFTSHAILLSQNLDQNEPCPVCGSVTHPNKVTGQHSAVAEQELTLVTDQLQKAINERDKGLFEQNQISERLEELNHDKQSLLAEMQNDQVEIKWEELEQTRQIIQRNSDEREKTISKLNANVSKATQLNVDKERSAQKLDKLSVKIDEQLQLVQEKREQFIQIQTDIKRLNADIPDEFKDEIMYRDRKEHIESIIKTFENQLNLAGEKVSQLKDRSQELQNRLTQSLEERDREKLKLEELTEKWDKSIKNSIFENEAQLIQSKMSENQMKKSEEDINQFEKTFFATKQQLDLKSSELQGKEKPDNQQLNEELSKVEQMIENLEGDLRSISSYIERHESIFTQIEESMVKTKELEEEYKLVGHLSEISNGDNHLRITFERYVLAFYLEDILLISNERLSKMTSGRYQLIRKEDRSKGNVQGGLELLVFDQYTGLERHVKTLSGGEAFKASLSLALGLADVVQSHAGGVSLETMFIDEGFGTLDPESLDQAIESLMDIQNSGRLVGVISHVPELKERIDARLEVESSKEGSLTRFIFSS